MYKLLLVGVGGFAGAVLRYLVAGFVQHITHSIAFPYGTLTVNVCGCFLIGALSYLADAQIGLTPDMRLLLMVGLLGSFTTYSTFSNETIQLLQDQRYLFASINVGAHLALGLASVLLGRFAAISLWR